MKYFCENHPDEYLENQNKLECNLCVKVIHLDNAETHLNSYEHKYYKRKGETI